MYVTDPISQETQKTVDEYHTRLLRTYVTVQEVVNTKTPDVDERDPEPVSSMGAPGAIDHRLRIYAYYRVLVFPSVFQRAPC